MADFKIKPAAGTGNKLILESEDGTDVLTTSDSGVAITAPTIADLSNVTGTLPVGVTGGSGLTALGSVPRFREYTHFNDPATTASTTSSQDNNNISHTYYLSVTPEHADDIIEFSYEFGYYWSAGYIGFGIERDTHTGFATNLATIWAAGRDTFGPAALIVGGEAGTRYGRVGGSVSFTASNYGMSADTTYYCRLIGMTHESTVNVTWGVAGGNYVLGLGTRLSMKRWSIA